METTFFRATVLLNPKIEKAVTPIKRELIVIAETCSEAESKLINSLSDEYKTVSVLSLEKSTYSIVV